MFYTTSGIRAAITKPVSTYEISLSAAKTRIAGHCISLNTVLRKYSISSTLRQAHFLAQVILETAQWRSSSSNPMIELMHEWYFGQYSAANPMTQHYGPFYGRGIMQLTWVGNYLNYGNFRSERSLRHNSGVYSEKLTKGSPRITATSLHWTGSPEESSSRQIQWAPRYDPNTIASDPYSACDSGGYYWVSKHHSGVININRVCDLPYTSIIAGRVNTLVNGGGNGYHERQAYVAYLMRNLGDDAANSDEAELNTPKGKVRVNFLRPTQ